MYFSSEVEWDTLLGGACGAFTVYINALILCLTNSIGLFHYIYADILYS